MAKNKKAKQDKQEVRIRSIKSNARVDEIVEDYPEKLVAYPRALFEQQLKEHLLKHGIK